MPGDPHWRHSDANGNPPPRPSDESLASTLSELTTTLIGQFIAAIVLVIAICVDHQPSTTQNYAYTVVVASVAALLALVGFALVHFSRSEQILFAAPLLGDLSAKALLCLFLTIWWAVGMYVITFIAPFTSTGNGYFAVWIGFACGIASVGATLPRLKASALSISSSTSLIVLGACALVVGLELSTGTDPRYLALIRQLIFGVVVSVFTFAAALTTLLLELSDAPLDARVSRSIYSVIVILWGTAAAWLTFTGPFDQQTGNGYFGLLVGFVCACRLVLDSQSRLIQALTNETLAAHYGQVASAVVIIVATVLRDANTTPLWGYALSVGIVACVLAFAGTLLIENPIGANVLCCAATPIGPATPSNLLALILFVWWGVGTGVLTINGPFSSTSNGYFAGWLGFGCSALNVGLTIERTREAAASGLANLAVLALCSLLLICTLAPMIANNSAAFRAGSAQIVYALIIACLTILEVAVAIYLRRAGKPVGAQLNRVLGFARFVVWTVLASWCSFAGPFLGTGNGYFAAWAGVVCSVLLIAPADAPQQGSDEERGDAADVYTSTHDGVSPLQAAAVGAPAAAGAQQPHEAACVSNLEGTYAVAPDEHA